ncbi:MAG: endonuclease/exonuclease/phosphatase family protein [Pyrinomonadaceae bacterium]
MVNSFSDYLNIKLSRKFYPFWVFLFLAIVCPFGVNAQKELAIAEIQGDRGVSPHVGETVRVNGVVTAILKNGFYIQTPDAQADKDPKTSEGIYVFGENNVGSVSIGNLVQVDGTVSEFRPRTEKIFLSITEISKPIVKVISKDNPLPAPIVLTSAELNPKGKLDQMERFEGMRVKADVTVVGPTSGYTSEKTGLSTSNGVFFAALQNTPRPFREAGIEILTIIAEKLPNTAPAFDMNPEILRVDSDTQVGAKPMDVPAGATVKGLTGVIDYSKQFYTLLVDAADPPTVENIRGFVPVSPAGEREVTVGSFNIENFFDDETNSSNVTKEAVLPKEVFKNRLNKVSLAIRNVLAMPDVLGIVEVENLKVLQKIADKVNADAVAGGKTDPKYVAYLEEGNDIRGIDIGFLVRSTKIKVVETKQLAKDVKLNYGSGSPDEKLFDRTPLLLKAEVIDAKSLKPLAFTVIVNHLKSYRGIDSEKDGDHTRNKRRLEAEWLASFVQDREKADPAERLILCGDFNAFQFNDGYNDLIGILRGKSDPNVLAPSKMVFTTGLVDLIDYIDPKNRYSYSYDGSAQALDHILVNKPVKERLLKFGYARVDADFPLVWSNDATRPERISDHDAPVVFLNLDEPLATKPSN